MNVQTEPRRVEDVLPVRLPANSAGDAPETIDLVRVFRGALRQSWLVAIFAFAGGIAAIAYATALTPLYTASTTILLDEERAELLDLVSAVPGAALRDSNVLSELELLKSHELAVRVVDRLDLVDRPEVLRVEPTPAAAAMSAMRGAARDAIDLVVGEEAAGGGAGDAGGPAREEDPRDEVASDLRRGLGVFRVGRSYVIELSYEAPSPVLARDVAQTYADAYIDFQLENNAAAAGDAVAWLTNRVEQLREAYLDTSRELADFRTEHGLVSVGGRLLSEQQLSEILSQIVTAEADAARARAMGAQAREALAEGPEAALAALMTLEETGRVAALNERLADARRQRREIVERFGADHPEAQRLEREIEAVNAQVMEELERRAAGAENDMRTNESRAASLRSGLETVLDETNADGAALYRLRQLEQTEESYQQLYRDALVRLERANQQQSVPIVATRVITPPEVPRAESSPSMTKYAALGIFLGAFMGGAVGLLREARRNPLATREDVQRYLGSELVASLPRLERRRSSGASRRGANGSHATHNDPRLPQTMRPLKLAIDLSGGGGGRGRAVGFVSARSGEGKTLVAVNFAAMLARHGYATLLIDGDPDGRSATHHFRTRHGRDLVSMVRDGAEPAEEDFERVGVSPLFLMPLGREEDPYSAVTFAGSARVGRVFEALRQSFDYIVLDLPAVRDAPDAGVFAPLMDSAVVVTRPRRADLAEVREVLETPTWEKRVVGVLLNRG